jgi:hypothetical protein
VPAELRGQLGDEDPAVVLRGIYQMPHEALKKMVRSAAGARAMGLKLQAAIAAMPYVHSKMPIAVTTDLERLPTLVIASGANQQQLQRLIDLQVAPASQDDDPPHGQPIERKQQSDT